MGPRAILDVCRKSCPHRDSILTLPLSAVNWYTDYAIVSNIHNKNWIEFQMLINFHTAKKFIMKHLSISRKIQESQRNGQLLGHFFLHRTASLGTCCHLYCDLCNIAFRNYEEVDCSRMCVHY